MSVSVQMNLTPDDSIVAGPANRRLPETRVQVADNVMIWGDAEQMIRLATALVDAAVQLRRVLPDDVASAEQVAALTAAVSALGGAS